MAAYIMLSKLTETGRRAIKERPGRIEEVNKEIQGMGARVVAQYAVLGPYDFVNIVEAADNETAARVSVELGGRGTVEIMTLPTIQISKLTKAVAKSRAKK